MRKQYQFNPKEAKTQIVDWIRKYFVENGPDCKAIIGMSGGKDSTIAAALCAEAIGPDRVIGVLMPQGAQHDIDMAIMACEFLGIQHYTININNACLVIYDAVKFGMNLQTLNDQAYTNTPARERMTVLYIVAALEHGRVVNTCNYSENYIGYSTKYGDHAGDFAPIQDFTVSELLAIGEVLKIPNELLYKVPEDGLSGKTDEDNLGFTYAELDKYLRESIVPNVNVLTNIHQRHKRNKHKTDQIRLPGPNSYYDWEF